MAIKWTNNASTTLASAISAVTTTITVASSGGSLFPSLGVDDYFYATLSDSSNNLEIVKVTARVGDVMTVVRGQDGTAGTAYVGGDKFELRPTAAGLGISFDKSGDTITGPSSVVVNSSSTAFRITQTGGGNALVVEDASNPDGTPFVIDTNGRVLTGVLSAPGSVFGGGYNPQVQVWGVGPATSSQSFASFNTAGIGNGSRMWLARSRGSFSAGVPSFGAVFADDTLGDIQFAGDDGTAGGKFVTAAQILSQVDGSPGTDDMPGRLIFSTTADGGSSPTERMRIDKTGKIGIGCTPTTYTLDVQNPDTTAGADTYVRIKSNAVDGDGDAQLYLDASDTGEAGVALLVDGVGVSYLQVINGDDYVQLTNEVSGADLNFMTAATAANDGYALRFARDTGEAVISGITGTITASALETTITGLSTTTGLSKGMFLTKTAGTGAFGVNAMIKYVDVAANTITIESSATMTAGSITFTATPNPTTIHIYSLSSGTWTTGQDFARLAFGNGDTGGTGDGGIKASINAYVYDTAGTGAGLDFCVSSNGTTLTRAARITQDGDFQFNSGYGSKATAYGCRAWVNFDGTATSNLSGTYSQTGTTVTVTATDHGLITGNEVYLDFTTGTAVDGSYTVTVTGPNTFTVTQASRTTSGNVTIARNAIRASANISSITDRGTGNYTVNFANALPDANYAVTALGTGSGGFTGLLSQGSSVVPTTTEVQLQNRTIGASSTSVVNCNYGYVAVFR